MKKGDIANKGAYASNYFYSRLSGHTKTRLW